MISLKNAISHLKARLSPRDIDTYLVSFPKCGRTWLRMMLGTAGGLHLGLEPEDPTDLHGLHKLDSRFPDIEPTHDRMAFQFAPSQMKFDHPTFDGEKVIFLARDPRDVMVSFFYHQKHRRNLEYDLPVFAQPADMIEAEKGGLPSLLAFYNMWQENAAACEDVMWLYYEDMHEDAGHEVRRIFDFVGMESVDQAAIETAVEQSRFDKMRAMEANQEVKNFRLTPGDPSNTETYKTRKGKIGGYVEELDNAAVERMNRVIGERLNPFFSRYY